MSRVTKIQKRNRAARDGWSRRWVRGYRRSRATQQRHRCGEGTRLMHDIRGCRYLTRHERRVAGRGIRRLLARGW